MTARAVLVIDMQQALVKGAYLEDQTLAAVNQVIDRAHGAGVPVVFVQHNHATFAPLQKGAPGWVIHSDLHRLDSDPVVEKTASDAFYATDLATLLSSERVEELVVTGLQTEFCVDATCRAALSNGFDVTLVADGHTTGDAHLSAADIIAHHNVTLGNLAHPTATITVRSAAEVRFE